MRVYGEQLNSVQTYVLSGQSAFEGQGIVNGRFICIATAWCFGKKRKKNTPQIAQIYLSHFSTDTNGIRVFERCHNHMEILNIAAC